MKSRIFFIVLLGGLWMACVTLWKQNERIRQERNRYRENTEALLSDVERLQVDSCRMALDVKAVRLTLEEYKRFRAEDAQVIRSLGVRLRDLQAVGRHSLSVDASFEVAVVDTVVVRDTVWVDALRVDMDTPHLRVSGLIEDGVLTGRVCLPVELHQAFWVEYGKRFLWWRWKVKAVHQRISCDNPHVEIGYSEVIRIGK